MSLIRCIGFTAFCLVSISAENLFGTAYGGSYENCVSHLIWAENEDPRVAQELCEELCPYNTHTCISREEYEYYENCEANENEDERGDDYEDTQCPE